MSTLLWGPDEARIEASNMYHFMSYVNRRYEKDFRTYNDLYRWSITEISDFWSSMWEYGEIICSSPFDEVVDDYTVMPGASWFKGARLNFAENLLRYRDDRIALRFKGEGKPLVSTTYAELYDCVARLAQSLHDMGIGAGERVIGFMPNMTETVIAMLATASLGAIWSSCSPDFGIKGVLDRFGQISPRVLFTSDGYSFNGKKINSLERIATVVKEIASVERVVVVPYINPDPIIAQIPLGVMFEDFLSKERGLKLAFKQLPANHPLYIMYSSGTTGVPKCMAHGIAGTLVQHLKELNPIRM